MKRRTGLKRLKVCDHNKHGFENCGNYISTDVAPKSEVARGIIEEIKKFQDKLSSRTAQYEIMGLVFALEKKYRLKKKYMEEGK